MRRAAAAPVRALSGETAAARRKVTAMGLLRMKRLGEKICMVTAHDYPSAAHVGAAGVDVALCGDSLGMVALGYADTRPVTLDEMLHHCRAARRGLGAVGDAPLLVMDLPFGAYEESPAVALRAAHRAVKEGGADGVKGEGGSPRVAATVETLVDAGVAVMGHVGLTPQAVAVTGGFRAQGRTARRARRLVDEALALERAGAFAVVAECVPATVGAALSRALAVPCVGIGAGPGCDGQVLVYSDLLGSLAHPHHASHVPRFCRVFAEVGKESRRGLAAFRDAVRTGAFPSDEYSPYAMSDAEAARFAASLARDADRRREDSDEVRRRHIADDEYEIAKLY